MKQCPKCQKEIKDSAKFCPKCGCNIAKYTEENQEQENLFCTECGNMLEPNSEYCTECGAKVIQEDIKLLDDDFFSSIYSTTAEQAKQKKVDVSLSSFEYQEHNDGTYTITGLKDKFALQYNIPDNVVSISENAFEKCNAIKIILPSGLMQIGNCAFKNCVNLESINLPNSLKIVGEEAFANCELLDITLPESVIRVGKNALLNTIQDKKVKAEEKARKEAEKWNVGSNLTFGSYYKDSSNIKEPIEWLVLKRENNKALITTKYGIECKKYNETYTNVTWETCTLRKWLNNDFYNNAFSSEEKNKLLNTKVHTPDNPKYNTKGGNDTNDKVFLLSIEEAEKYFSSNKSRECKPTPYAKQNGAYLDSDNGNCWWWLRSPGLGQCRAAGVGIDGCVYYIGNCVNNDDGCVRPALWINL